MSDLSARLYLPLIRPSQAQKHVTHNEALQVLDGLVQATLEDTGAETPPYEPAEGQLYALGASPAGAWAGEGGKLALRVAGAWLFIAPQEGWHAWDKATGRFRVFTAGNWAVMRPDMDNLDGIGVGTISDSTNRLAVASRASLFSHAGAGHRIKVNKAADTETAALLFQSGWTGHAEMGLAGDTAFSIKVSEDGSNWQNAMRIDAGAGEIAFDMKLAGSAGQRIYTRDNLVGPVSQSGGAPTGAVVERGSNANGEYLRLADGTQIATNGNDAITTAPAAFAGTITKTEGDKLWIGRWY